LDPEDKPASVKKSESLSVVLKVVPEGTAIKGDLDKSSLGELTGESTAWTFIASNDVTAPTEATLTFSFVDDSNVKSELKVNIADKEPSK